MKLDYYSVDTLLVHKSGYSLRSSFSEMDRPSSGAENATPASVSTTSVSSGKILQVAYKRWLIVRA